MERPKEYIVRDLATNNEERRSIPPSQYETHQYIPIEEGSNIYKLTEVKRVYVDMSYELQMRLYRIKLYQTDRERHDREFNRKSIYHGTEIGKSIPILPF